MNETSLRTRRRTVRFALLALSVGLSLALAACGGGESSASAAGGGVGGACVPANPISCLMPIPAGATPSTVPPANGPLTKAQFVSTYYAGQSTAMRQEVSGDLDADAVRSIAHRGWAIANGDRADVVVLEFGNSIGSQDDAQAVIRGTRADATRTTVTLPGVFNRYRSVAVFASKTVDSDGNIQGFAYVPFGTVEMQFFFYSPATVDTATFASWLGRELALLNTSG